jgi:hypothetical protein
MEEIQLQINDPDDNTYTQLLHNEMATILDREQKHTEEQLSEWYAHFRHNDSPMSMSGNNSEEEDNAGWGDDSQLFESYGDINKYSNELDMLNTYLKGQKCVYMYSNYISRTRLHILTLTSLLFTSSIAIFTPFVGLYSWSTGLIVVLNALTTLMISVSNHLKLESKAENYFNIAMQYDKLETSLEFKNNAIMFGNQMDAKKMIHKKMAEIEHELIQLKESTTFVMPTEIKQEFPLIMHINVFSIIKRIETLKHTLCKRFAENKKETRFILRHYAYSVGDNGGQKKYAKDGSREKKRLLYLAQMQESIKTDMEYCKNAYSYVDYLITLEINSIDIKKKWMMRRQEYIKKQANPIIDEYLQSIIPGLA